MVYLRLQRARKRVAIVKQMSIVTPDGKLSGKLLSRRLPDNISQAVYATILGWIRVYLQVYKGPKDEAVQSFTNAIVPRILTALHDFSLTPAQEQTLKQMIAPSLKLYLKPSEPSARRAFNLPYWTILIMIAAAFITSAYVYDLSALGMAATIGGAHVLSSVAPGFQNMTSNFDPSDVLLSVLPSTNCYMARVLKNVQVDRVEPLDLSDKISDEKSYLSFLKSLPEHVQYIFENVRIASGSTIKDTGTANFNTWRAILSAPNSNVELELTQPEDSGWWKSLYEGVYGPQFKSVIYETIWGDKKSHHTWKTLSQSIEDVSAYKRWELPTRFTKIVSEWIPKYVYERVCSDPVPVIPTSENFTPLTEEPAHEQLEQLTAEPGAMMNQLHTLYENMSFFELSKNVAIMTAIVGLLYMTFRIVRTLFSQPKAIPENIEQDVQEQNVQSVSEELLITATTPAEINVLLQEQANTERLQGEKLVEISTKLNVLDADQLQQIECQHLLKIVENESAKNHVKILRDIYNKLKPTRRHSE